MKRSCLILLVLAAGCGFLFLLPCSLFALDPTKTPFQYNSKTWRRENGLPANAVSAITQTRDGYLWVGTQRGLVRYDGVEFRVLDLPNKPQFRNQMISTLAASRDGGLWFGIRSGSLGCYRDGSGFSTLEQESWVEPTMNVQAIQETSDGALWVGSDKATARWVKDNLLQTHYYDDLPGGLMVHEGTQGRVWVGTADRGLFYWQAGKLVAFPDSSLAKESVLALVEDRAGQLWVGTRMGLRCYDSHFNRKEVPATEAEVRALLLDSHGVLWIGTTGRGTICCRNGTFTYFQTLDGSGSENVNALYEDREGSVWIGTRNGLTQLSDVKLPIYSTTEGILGGGTHGVCASRGGGVWVATTLGVSYLDSHTNRNYGPEIGLLTRYIKQVFEGKNGDLFLIDGDKNLEVMSDGKIVARYTNTNWPTALAEDSKGAVASVAGSLFRVSRNQLVPFTFKDGNEPPLYWVRGLSSCRDGSLLVASVNGIFRVNDGIFQQWSMDNGLPDNDVLWVIEDSDGTLWAGLSTGICRITGRQIRKITTNEGLFDNYVFALVPDNHGSFWMNSSRGFFRVSRKSLNDFADGKVKKVECTPFDGLEAVKAVDTTDVEYSGCKTLDGRIWFPGPQGIVMANPQHLITNPVAPPTHIQQVRANGLELLTETHPAVRPGRGELEIQYTAVSFIEPQKLRFRYRLEGYDTQWIDAGVRRSAFYTNLKPGKYRFRVQACNTDGFWNTADDSVELELPPQFYQTTWFETLCALLALVVLTGLYAMGVRHLSVKQRRLQEINEMLESKVAERTRELAAQRNLLRTLIDHLPDNFFVKDTGGRVVLDNIAHARMIGVHDPEEAVGKTDFDRFSADLAEKCRADEKRVLELGEVYNGEESLVNMQTGDQRWFQTTKVPLRDAQGTIVGLAGINRDITERRKTEEELRQKTALFEALVNSSLDGILVVSQQGKRILQNQQTVDLWKIPREIAEQDLDEVQVRHVMNMAKDPEQFRQQVQHLYSHPDETSRGEHELKDGTVLDRYTAPIRSRDGIYYGRIWMFRDITERKRMEVEMERTHNELLQASRQAGMAEVATSVLHNVGNVLNSVNVSASVVEDRIKKSSTENLVKVLTLLRQHENDLAQFLTRDEKGRQLIRYLEVFTQHLDAEKADLLQELKHLGRNIEHIKEIVAMQQTYARVAGVTVIIRVSELVEDVLQMNALSYERHEVTLVREFSEVPAITADRHKIIQILLNLLQNAMQACNAAGSNNPRVVVRIGMAGPGRIRIEVSDNGIGIPAENLTRIFSHGFTTRKNGHGFGLHSGALAAKGMGGVLSLRRDGSGKGATFVLELPVEYKPGPAGGGAGQSDSL